MFSWLGIFRQGAWRSFRSFALLQKKDVPKRIAVIDAELRRIGNITVVYEQTRVGSEIKVTEKRRGLFVTPNSSLEKLLQAYIAHGGNPFDLSLYLQPDDMVVIREGQETIEVPAYPYGGILTPRTVPLSEIGPSDGGYLPHNSYLPYRLGSRQVVWDKSMPIAEAVQRVRGWIGQEIAFRNRMEERILKLMDLREQLLTERDEVIEQSVGGTITGVGFRNEFFSQAHRVHNIMNTIDSVFYGKDDSGNLTYDLPGIKDRLIGRYQTLLDDLQNGEEDWTAL